ncbi:hypothetical protein L1049_014249 [Liquidambar formosana]|uniref:Protein LURP-one-related 7 n=1 Tax=Liquidambar formosana TaxID=63359 RepID=A0AAP0WXI4_LIQFO
MASTAPDDTMASTAPVYPANLPIPVDLFVSKKHPGLTRGDLGFADSSGDIVFTVNVEPPKSALPRHKRVLLDAAGNPLISIYLGDDGCWQGFRGNDGMENKELIFRVKTTRKTLTRTELEVFLVGENQEDSKANFEARGCPFQRSCTIYEGNSIVAQTSLMYKLRQVFVGRCRFLLTVFLGPVDHALFAAVIAIFFYGKD